jgi:hypothetical protein
MTAIDTIKKLLFSIIWLVVLVFIAWPVACFCATFWIFLMVTFLGIEAQINDQHTHTMRTLTHYLCFVTFAVFLHTPMTTAFRSPLILRQRYSGAPGEVGHLASPTWQVHHVPRRLYSNCVRCWPFTKMATISGTMVTWTVAILHVITIWALPST